MGKGSGSAEYEALEREVTTLRARVADLQRAAARHRDDGQDGEVSLAEREELLREAERIAHFGTWTWEPESGAVTWSDEMFRILGLDPEVVEPSLEAFYGLVHPEDLPRAIERKDDQTRDGVLPLTELRIVRPDGDIRHTSVTSMILFDEAGVQRKIVGGVLDRTEGLATELKLRRTLSQLEEAQRFAKLGSWRFDPSSGEIEWSAEYRRIIGVAPDAAPNLATLMQRIAPEFRARIQANHERLLAGEQPQAQNVEVQLQLPNGEKRHVRFEGFVVKTTDGRDEMRGTILDVTDDVRLRRELAESQKTEAIGRLAGGIAHDFNNLLMVISGNLQVLQATIGERRELSDSLKALESAASLTRRLLAFGRQAPLTLERTDLNAMLQSTTDMLHRLVGDDVQLALALGADLPMISVDAVEIERALVNLVVNARDVMPNGGVVRVSSAKANLGSKPAVALSVADEGPGIAEADLPHIFDPFFTTRDGAGGTGLGLATVLGTAEQHGGKVRVASNEGGGSVFTIVLPLADTQEASPTLTDAKATPPSPQPTTDSLRILVVDDEVAVAYVTRKLLEAMGHTVDVTSAPDEALSLWRQHGADIDLVVCDVALGATRGPDVVKRMAEDGSAPCVLFITGYSEEAAVAQLGHPVLAKPFTMERLASAVGRAVREAASAG